MSMVSFLDIFCHSVVVKHRDPWEVTPQALGNHYGEFLVAEAGSSEKVVPAFYIPFNFPFEGCHALHFAYGESPFVILYEDAGERMKSCLHEAGEIIRARLRTVWPSYRPISELEELILGDCWGDAFAEAAIIGAASAALDPVATMQNVISHLFGWLENLSSDLLTAASRQCERLKSGSTFSTIRPRLVHLVQAVGDLIIAILEWGGELARELLRGWLRLVKEYRQSSYGVEGGTS